MASSQPDSMDSQASYKSDFFYFRAFSSEEIRYNWNRHLDGNEKKLIGLWKFDRLIGMSPLCIHPDKALFIPCHMMMMGYYGFMLVVCVSIHPSISHMSVRHLSIVHSIVSGQ